MVIIWLLLCFSLENRHYLDTCECSCILSPHFENFCPNNGQIFSVGDATASPASPCRTLMSTMIGTSQGNICGKNTSLDETLLLFLFVLLFCKTHQFRFA